MLFKKSIEDNKPIMAHRDVWFNGFKTDLVLYFITNNCLAPGYDNRLNIVFFHPAKYIF